jgi:uncharacterized protein YjgD (DUF1641 family)
MGNDLAELNQKIDLLTSQVVYMNEQLEYQRQRLQAFEELKNDLVPIANHMFRLTIDELAEIGSDFQVEDLFFLVKRLLRDTDLLVRVLDRMEGIMDLADEGQLLGKQVFNNTVEKLDLLEQQGYFTFARGAAYIMERIVSEFSEEDVRALGDNIVTILSTVRNMTQPEVLSLANQVVDSVRDEPDSAELSTIGLLRELGDPKVRKGMARMLRIVKGLADQPSLGIPPN